MNTKPKFKDEKLRHLNLSAPLCVSEESSLRSVIDKMQKLRCPCALVCRGDLLTGIFTERDVLIKVMGNTIDLESPIRRYMTPHPLSLTPEDSIGTAVEKMNDGGYRNLPIVDAEGKVAGLVSVRDIIVFLAEHFPVEVFNLPPRLHQNMQSPEGA